MSSRLRHIVSSWLLEHPHFNPYGFTIDRFWRTITSQSRMLPDYIITGFAKTGSTSLSEYLEQHPNIGVAGRKEIRFFDLTYWRGINWYKSYFPTLSSKQNFEQKYKQPYITGETTPFYIYHPFAIQRMKQIIPNVKLVVTLRNPIDRAYSHYNHHVRLGFEKKSFEDAIKDDKDRFSILQNMLVKDQLREYNQKYIHMPYLTLGLYANYLKNLISSFPREQILIIQSEDMKKNTQNTLEKIFSFLKIPNYTIKDVGIRKLGKYEQMNSETRVELVDYYKPHNEELEKLLGTSFNWNR